MIATYLLGEGGDAAHSHLKQFSLLATWIYWGLMGAAFLFGFIPRRRK
jgi:hypothetical protein